MALMRATIGEALGWDRDSDEVDLLLRRIDALNDRMLTLVNETVQNGGDMEDCEDEFKTISEQIEQLQQHVETIRRSQSQDTAYEKRLATIQKTIDQRQANQSTYDDTIVRQMIECIKVHNGGRLEVIFGGGYAVEEYIE